MKKLLIILPVIIVLLIVIAFAFRISKDISKKLKFTNIYSIKNLKSGKAVRVHNAGIDDGTGIILYDHHNWECMTWQMIQLEDNTFLLKNQYTQKTFQPSSAPGPGVGLWQQPLGGTPLQHWEFIKQPDDTYRIRLKGTRFYLTAASEGNNTPVVLMPEQGSDSQLWRLVRQNPLF